MKTVIIENKEKDVIVLDMIEETTPIFAYDRYGKLSGMLIYEPEGWIVRIGRDFGSSGHYETREECIKEETSEFGRTFKIED